jgi:hypothetical protein
MRKIRKPGTNEYPPYAKMYIDLLPDDQLILDHLKENFVEVQRFILSLPPGN